MSIPTGNTSLPTPVLHKEMLLHIASYLNPKALLSASSVCREWEKTFMVDIEDRKLFCLKTFLTRGATTEHYLISSQPARKIAISSSAIAVICGSHLMTFPVTTGPTLYESPIGVINASFFDDSTLLILKEQESLLHNVNNHVQTIKSNYNNGKSKNNKKSKSPFSRCIHSNGNGREIAAYADGKYIYIERKDKEELIKLPKKTSVVSLTVQPVFLAAMYKSGTTLKLAIHLPNNKQKFEEFKQIPIKSKADIDSNQNWITVQTTSYLKVYNPKTAELIKKLKSIPSRTLTKYVLKDKGLVVSWDITTTQNEKKTQFSYYNLKNHKEWSIETPPSKSFDYSKGVIAMIGRELSDPGIRLLRLKQGRISQTIDIRKKPASESYYSIQFSAQNILIETSQKIYYWKLEA